MERIIKGEVVKFNAKCKPYLAIDTPPKQGKALPIEGILILNEIFMPYVGITISITKKDKEGKGTENYYCRGTLKMVRIAKDTRDAKHCPNVENTSIGLRHILVGIVSIVTIEQINNPTQNRFSK